MKIIVAVTACLVAASSAVHAADERCAHSTRCVARTDGDERITRFNQRVLESMHIDYTVEKLTDGRSSVWWTPRDETEENEVNGRVSQYAIAIRACSKDYWPSPETPAGSLKRCTP